MADPPGNIAVSVKQRLLNMARAQRRGFDILLVRFALERLLFRLSQSPHRDSFILKGGMLVTQWLDHDHRETRDADFLGFGKAEVETIKATFAEIMSIAADDGLDFDTDAIVATSIREEMEYGGIRLKTSSYLERTRIPVTLDIAFGDAVADAGQTIDYPSLLGMDRPTIRAYPPVQVIAEKFQAVVALGLVNGRMKDFYDLWAIPQAISLDDQALDDALAATFGRRTTPIPSERPPGLSTAMTEDAAAQQRWRAYAESLDLPVPEFAEVLDDIWTLLAPACARLVRE
ncbi:nucleotidyl transferase AbiEii/AbiGii toxin family protein [Qipengyuania qiaonensis]|uniref:Nucleotidyl transferase AbiEii/AbiGii toxin family protein n=1 Tax=Qipengyuania qiaonensis TaxID=2867240 RepID=A0ABS7J776_9SPHN|nr:nucleotidyl transferase AbiEii/AbiGii toxin family protein [Qipengyuania qiaonensis]MBX7482161.1 nucleotidyl transferase AbiEii/AbiGii toxin family protein [Qipengyuania qiaonensis]